jgi:hypothetical protein
MDLLSHGLAVRANAQRYLAGEVVPEAKTHHQGAASMSGLQRCD